MFFQVLRMVRKLLESSSRLSQVRRFLMGSQFMKSVIFLILASMLFRLIFQPLKLVTAWKRRLALSAQIEIWIQFAYSWFSRFTADERQLFQNCCSCSTEFFQMSKVSLVNLEIYLDHLLTESAIELKDSSESCSMALACSSLPSIDRLLMFQSIYKRTQATQTFFWNCIRLMSTSFMRFIRAEKLFLSLVERFQIQLRLLPSRGSRHSCTSPSLRDTGLNFSPIQRLKLYVFYHMLIYYSNSLRFSTITQRPLASFKSALTLSWSSCRHSTSILASELSRKAARRLRWEGRAKEWRSRSAESQRGKASLERCQEATLMRSVYLSMDMQQ